MSEESKTPRTDNIAAGWRGMNFREEKWYSHSKKLELALAEKTRELEEAFEVQCMNAKDVTLLSMQKADQLKAIAERLAKCLTNEISYLDITYKDQAMNRAESRKVLSDFEKMKEGQ